MKNFLDENSKNTEENNNRNLAEHLFQILAPGQRCVLDDKTKYGADEEDDNGRTDTDGQSDTGMSIPKRNQSLVFFLF